MAGILVVLAGCATDEATTTSTDPIAPPAGAALVGQLEPLAVIGGGRATQASSSTGVGGVIATTIGLDQIDQDGRITAVPTGVDLPARDVILSPDGQFAIASGSTRTELWALGPTPTSTAGFDGVTAAAFTSDSATLITSTPSRITATAVGAPDTPRTLVDAPVGTELGTPTMTADGSVIVAPVSGDGVDIVSWDESSGPVAMDVFTEATTKIVRAELTDDGTRVLITTSSGDPFQESLASWSAAGGVAWEIDVGDLGMGTPWDVGADGGVLLADESGLRVIGPDGNVAAEWPFDGQQSVTTIVATRTGYAVAFSNSTLLFTGLDGTPIGPAVSTGQQLVDLEPLTGADGVVAVDLGGTVRSWSADGVALGESTTFRAGSVNDVVWSTDDAAVAFGSTAGLATVVDVADTSQVREFVHPEGNVDSVALGPDGSTLVTGVGERLSDIAFDDTVSLWNLTDGARAATSGGQGEDVNGCANFRNTVEFSPDGSVFAASSHDFTVSIHRADTGELLQTLPPHVSTVLDLAFSPTGDRLVTASDDGSVRVWNVGDFTLLSEFIGPPGGYWSLAFMPDGNSLVVSDLTGAIRQIDVATGSEILAYSGVTTRTGHLAVSPDGSLVAAASDGSSVGIWSTTTGNLVSQNSGHQAPVTSAVFSTDGSRLATGSGDATVRIWAVG